jgi:hypothetical protein
MARWMTGHLNPTGSSGAAYLGLSKDDLPDGFAQRP